MQLQGAGREAPRRLGYVTMPDGTASDRGWRHFAHGADLGVCGWGPTLAAAFEQAALALTAAVTAAQVAARDKVEVTCEAADRELLLVDWLNAIIYEMAVRRMLFGRFEVRIDGCRLAAVIRGEKIDPRRHQPACEPKGATYTELQVAQDARGVWTARCVVDV